MNRRILIYEDTSSDLQEHLQYLAQSNQSSTLHFFDAA
jgi:hypothetical protein